MMSLRLMRHDCAHTTPMAAMHAPCLTAGVTLPMSSDSSLYRIPWMEQYIGVAGGLGNAGSGSAQAGSNGVRGDSDEGLERSFPISGVDLVSYLER